MSTNATEGGQGQESGTPNGTPAGQESQGQAGQGQESGQQGTPSEGQFDLATITDPTIRSYVEAQQKQAREAREEAARFRTERKTLADQVSEYQRQNESEQDRIAREAAEREERMTALEQENRALKVGQAIEKGATDAKAFNPTLVAGMLESKVTLDEQGQPTNLKDLLKDLRQSDPYLFKRADNNGGEGTGQQAAPTGSMNDLIRGQVAARRGRTS